MKNFKERMNTLSGGKVLDVATGRGEFIHVLINVMMEYQEFIGIDTSDRSVAFAAEAFATEPVSIEKMDAANMRFKDASFDTVAISNSLHHMPVLDDVLSEMVRVLRDGGSFIVREMICDADQSPAQMNHVDLHHWWAKIDTRLGITHRPTYTRAQLDNIMRAVPLSKIDSWKFDFAIENPHDPELLDRMTQMMGPYVERLADHADYEILKEEGDMIKARLKEHGYAPATTLFYVGEK